MRAPKRGRASKDESGEIWARITGHRSNYYISRHGSGEDECADDEAELHLTGMIDAITAAQRRYLGAEFEITLLAAEKYGAKEKRSSHFFGSVNLRKSQRSALAYLPSTPFWALPRLIEGRDLWVCVGWSSMSRGYGELSSVFLGDARERDRLLELSGDTIARSAPPQPADLQSTAHLETKLETFYDSQAPRKHPAFSTDLCSTIPSVCFRPICPASPSFRKPRRSEFID